MSDIILSKTTLSNQDANAFIDEFCRKNEAETSKIIAGMVAVINGNEESLEKMKNQKWFERIWHTISGKNNAVVKEMQQNRDILNKYLVQMVTKITEMVKINSAQAAELSSAILALDDELREMKIDIHNIAMDLNDKILSLDNYNFIITDIQNHKYPTDQPLLSLIDIVSQLDRITAGDAERLQQLKETMEENGFSFNSQVDTLKYAEQVLSLPEEKIGRILLFCQNFSHSSRFLAFTGSLIENYFYLGETDRREVKQSGEAVQNALRRSGLRENSGCVISDMYTDLKKVVPDRYAALSSLAEEFNVEQVKKIPRRIKGIVAGRKGVGKSVLLSSILEYEGLSVQAKRIGSAKFDQYISANGMLTLYETAGLELGNMSGVIQNIINLAAAENVNVLLYCVDITYNRFEDVEKKLIDDLRSSNTGLTVYIVLTNCTNPKGKNVKELTDFILSQVGYVKFIPILAKDEEIGSATIPAYGVQELIDEVAYE